MGRVAWTCSRVCEAMFQVKRMAARSGTPGVPWLRELWCAIGNRESETNLAYWPDGAKATCNRRNAGSPSLVCNITYRKGASREFAFQRKFGMHGGGCAFWERFSAQQPPYQV